MQCLMLETKDNRRFFTYVKNYPQLIDFAKTFNVEIHTVETDENVYLNELSEIPVHFCNNQYKTEKVDFDIVESKITDTTSERLKILKTADQIQDCVMQTFRSGGIVSLKDLKTKFAKNKLTTACFCNHVRRSIQTLAKQGIKTQKVGAGKYKAINVLSQY